MRYHIDQVAWCYQIGTCSKSQQKGYSQRIVHCKYRLILFEFKLKNYLKRHTRSKENNSYSSSN